MCLDLAAGMVFRQDSRCLFPIYTIELRVRTRLTLSNRYVKDYYQQESSQENNWYEYHMNALVDLCNQRH